MMGVANRENAINSEELALKAAAILDEKQAGDILVLDVRGKSSVTDCHVLATGTSGPHLRSLVSEVQKEMKALGVPGYRVSGSPDSGWVVLDFVDAVIHVFSSEARAYYDLEGLWKDAPRIPMDA